MASENVVVFRAGIEAFNSRDPEAFVAYCLPDCEWHPFLSTKVEGKAAFIGHEGIRSWFSEIDAMFREVHAEVEEIRDLGDRIVALGEIRGRGRESGAEVTSAVGWFLEVRDGMMHRGWAFTSHAEALAAAGLSD